MQQLRQEIGVRVCEKVFDPATDKPSKVSGFNTLCSIFTVVDCVVYLQWWILLYIYSGGCALLEGSSWTRAYLPVECNHISFPLFITNKTDTYIINLFNM